MKGFAVLAAVVAVAAVAPHVQAAIEDDLRDADKFFDDGDYKRAAGAFDRAIAKAPGEVPAVAYGKRAAIFIILKDYKGGLEFIGRAKVRYPNAPELLEQEALILWENDKQQEAVAVAEQVVRARPAAFTNQKLIGEFYAQRDPKKSAAGFEGYLAHRPPELEGGDTMPRLQLGFDYLANARAVLADGDDKLAQETYRSAVTQFEYVTRKLAKKPNAIVNAENGLCAAYTGLGLWDQAINLCERISGDPRRVDSAGSVWFNLSKAYLARKQTKKARSAASEFARMRKNEARGFMLIGDTYFDDRDYAGALEQYLRAEKALKPTQTRESVELSIQLGKTYRRMPAPASGPNKNLELAVDKLADAYSRNRESVELAVELGSAYLAAHEDGKAASLTEKLIDEDSFAQMPAQRRAAVLVLSGKAQFNQHKLVEARQRFAAARELRPADVQIQRALVATINEQAFAEKDRKAAQALLDEARALDSNSPTTLTNIALLAIERGDCDGALGQLARLDGLHGSDAVVVGRLRGRAYLCAAKPDPAKAGEAYAAAEREAKKANAQVALAEIYIEWAPLLWDTDLAGAVEKLELAASVTANSSDTAPAAKRNLALALFRRGWKSLQAGKAADASSDFDRALRDASVLRGTEPLAFEVSLGLAQLDANRSAEAIKLFKDLGTKGNQATYLKGGYAKAGTALLSAYAMYRSTQGVQRQRACADLSKLEPDLGARGKELVASCWEMVAFDQWRADQLGPAQKSLELAEKTASAEQKRRLDLDHAALSLTKDKLAALEALGGAPPEALVNLGIVYDLLGRPRDAYDAWTKAKAKGVNARDLQKWLDAKKRIYGY